MRCEAEWRNVNSLRLLGLVLERRFFQKQIRIPENSIFCGFSRSLAVPASDRQTFGLMFPPDPLSKAPVGIQSMPLHSRPLVLYNHNCFPIRGKISFKRDSSGVIPLQLGPRFVLYVAREAQTPFSTSLWCENPHV